MRQVAFVFRNSLAIALCLTLVGPSIAACDSSDRPASVGARPTVSIVDVNSSVGLYTLLQYLAGLSKGDVRQMDAVLCTGIENGESLVGEYEDYVAKHGPIRLQTRSLPVVESATTVRVTFLVGQSEFDVDVAFGAGETAFGDLCIEEITSTDSLPLWSK